MCKCDKSSSWPPRYSLCPESSSRVRLVRRSCSDQMSQVPTCADVRQRMHCRVVNQESGRHDSPSTLIQLSGVRMYVECDELEVLKWLADQGQIDAGQILVRRCPAHTSPYRMTFVMLGVGLTCTVLVVCDNGTASHDHVATRQYCRAPYHVPFGYLHYKGCITCHYTCPRHRLTSLCRCCPQELKQSRALRKRRLSPGSRWYASV